MFPVSSPGAFAWHHVRSFARRYVRSWGNPEQQIEAADQRVRSERYARLWDLYTGVAFDDMTAWAEYRRHHGLYRQIRLLWDHAHSLVEFYATHIWSGSLAEDGLDLPDGVDNAVPLAQDTDPKLAAAVGQLWLWWNFQEQMTMIPRYGAALGEVMVELIDDVDRGKILMEMIWPAYVADVQIDESGNIKFYAIEYQAWDVERQEWYLYRRESDKDSFRTFRNGDPFDFGRGAVVENPYGFVPACWFRHIRVIGVRGEPAIWSTQGALDEVNALLSHVVDKAHIGLKAPIIVAGNIAPNALAKVMEKMSANVRRVFTEDLDEPRTAREDLNVLEGPAGTKVETIDVRISETMVALSQLIAGIERKCPEVTFYEELRGMTQLTGPAASRLLGDVDHKIRSISAGYDRQLIKLLQMGVSMAGWRASNGDWLGTQGAAGLSDEQTKFTGFDLDSYAKGALRLNIMPRQLVPMTVSERMLLLQQKKQALTIIPDRVLALEAGYDEEEVAEWERLAEEKKIADQEQQMAVLEATAKARGANEPKEAGDQGPPGRKDVPPAQPKRDT